MAISVAGYCNDTIIDSTIIERAPVLHDDPAGQICTISQSHRAGQWSCQVAINRPFLYVILILFLLARSCREHIVGPRCSTWGPVYPTGEKVLKFSLTPDAMMLSMQNKKLADELRAAIIIYGLC